MSRNFYDHHFVTGYEDIIERGFDVDYGFVLRHRPSALGQRLEVVKVSAASAFGRPQSKAVVEMENMFYNIVSDEQYRIRDASFRHSKAKMIVGNPLKIGDYDISSFYLLSSSIFEEDQGSVIGSSATGSSSPNTGECVLNALKTMVLVGLPMNDFVTQMKEKQMLGDVRLFTSAEFFGFKSRRSSSNYMSNNGEMSRIPLLVAEVTKKDEATNNFVDETLVVYLNVGDKEVEFTYVTFTGTCYLTALRSRQAKSTWVNPFPVAYLHDVQLARLEIQRTNMNKSVAPLLDDKHGGLCELVEGCLSTFDPNSRMG